jgi:hypothetical protein
MTDRIPEWQTIFGAKVKSPVDMPDDILRVGLAVIVKNLSLKTQS